MLPVQVQRLAHLNHLSLHAYIGPEEPVTAIPVILVVVGYGVEYRLPEDHHAGIVDVIVDYHPVPDERHAVEDLGLAVAAVRMPSQFHGLSVAVNHL